MFKYKVTAFILLTTVLMAAQAYCQQVINGQEVLTVSGKVTYLDVQGDVIKVETDNGPMMFNLSVESDLFRLTHHIGSTEIKSGDPVTIQYLPSVFGDNIIKLVDNNPDEF